jgi:hypothetical protein
MLDGSTQNLYVFQPLYACRSLLLFGKYEQQNFILGAIDTTNWLNFIFRIIFYDFTLTGGALLLTR